MTEPENDAPAAAPEPPEPDPAVAPEPPAAEPAEAPEPPAAEPAEAPGPPASGLAPGAVVDGTVSRVTTHLVYLTLPGDDQGILDRREVEELQEQSLLQEGASTPVYVMNRAEDLGLYRLSRVMARGVRSPETLPACFEDKVPVEGKIGPPRKGGFDVHICGQRAFLPASQADVVPVGDKEAYVGLIDRFAIIEYNARRSNIVVSRRKVLEREARAIKEELRGAIEAGQQYEGEVKQVKEYGVFVDIGGVEGLVHATELSWNRVDDPGELLSIGDKVAVQVIRYSTESGKLSLSIKRLTPNPWSLLGSEIAEDSVQAGKVVSIVEYGAFVELRPGLEGLVHNSELSWDPSVRRAEEVLDIGDEVEVKLLSYDRKRRRISLSIKATADNPWATVADDYPVGTMAKGVIERIAKFGVFVSLAPGVTALIPVSRTGVPREISLLRRFHPGAPIEAEVIEVDPRRQRITLSLSGPDEHQDRDVSSFLKKQKKENVSLGTLGDLLGGLTDDDE